MDLLASLQLGLATAFEPQNLLYAFIGVTMGQIIGVLPGLGPMTAISLLLPVTFYLDPTQSMIMLAGVYYGSQYGGAIASILLHLPGTPASVITCLEGYPMARKGRAGSALFLASIASLFGSVVGIAILTVGALPLARFALEFGPLEYFSLILLGMIGASFVASGSQVRAIAMLVLGILLGLVGTDVNTGVYRFVVADTLADGISLIAIAMGLFGLAEVFYNIGTSNPAPKMNLGFGWRDMLPTRAEMQGFTPSATRGAAIGSAFGVLPGTGPAIASFVAYAAEKRIAKDPGQFGTGRPEGLVSPESSNNAAAITAFIPTMTLGIPGDPIMALMLGALIMNGVVPGPTLVAEHPTLFWGLIASFLVGNALLVLLNLPLIKLWVRLLSIPNRVLYPAVVVLICVAVFSFRNSVVDLYTTLLFGLLGALMMRFSFPAAPLLLGFILGPMLEQYLRRSMLIYDGDLTAFFTNPLSAVFMLTAIALLFMPMASSVLRKMKRQAELDMN